MSQFSGRYTGLWILAKTWLSLNRHYRPGQHLMVNVNQNKPPQMALKRGRLAQIFTFLLAFFPVDFAL